MMYEPPLFGTVLRGKPLPLRLTGNEKPPSLDFDSSRKEEECKR